MEPESKDTSKLPDITMLTADLAFTVYPDYCKVARFYCQELDALSTNFATVGYRLTSQTWIQGSVALETWYHLLNIGSPLCFEFLIASHPTEAFRAKTIVSVYSLIC